MSLSSSRNNLFYYVIENKQMNVSKLWCFTSFSIIFTLFAQQDEKVIPAEILRKSFIFLLDTQMCYSVFYHKQ